MSIHICQCNNLLFFLRLRYINMRFKLVKSVHIFVELVFTTCKLGNYKSSDLYHMTAVPPNLCRIILPTP